MFLRVLVCVVFAEQFVRVIANVMWTPVTEEDVKKFMDGAKEKFPDVSAEEWAKKEEAVAAKAQKLREDVEEKLSKDEFDDDAAKEVARQKMYDHLRKGGKKGHGGRGGKDGKKGKGGHKGKGGKHKKRGHRGEHEDDPDADAGEDGDSDEVDNRVSQSSMGNTEKMTHAEWARMTDEEKKAFRKSQVKRGSKNTKTGKKGGKKRMDEKKKQKISSAKKMWSKGKCKKGLGKLKDVAKNVPGAPIISDVKEDDVKFDGTGGEVSMSIDNTNEAELNDKGNSAILKVHQMTVAAALGMEVENDEDLEVVGAMTSFSQFMKAERRLEESSARRLASDEYIFLYELASDSDDGGDYLLDGMGNSGTSDSSTSAGGACRWVTAVAFLVGLVAM